MFKELFTNIRPRWGYYVLVVLALLLLVAGAGLAQRLSSRIPVSSNLDLVAGQPLDSGEAVSNFSKSVQPSGDKRSADVISRSGDATAYDVQLEKLAQQGRAAFAATRLPVSADAYAYYLNRLRLLGQSAQTARIKPEDANSFSAYLDQLRRMASEQLCLESRGSCR
jgi:hypothetical protein